MRRPSATRTTPRCARTASATATRGISVRSPHSSRCRTASPTWLRCGRTTRSSCSDACPNAQKGPQATPGLISRAEPVRYPAVEEAAARISVAGVVAALEIDLAAGVRVRRVLVEQVANAERELEI